MRATAKGRAAGIRSAFGFLSGSGSVGGGALLAGLGTYAFLSLSARGVGPARFAPLSAMWSLTLIMGPGVFLPVQQELARSLGARRGTQGGRDVVRRAAWLGAALAATATVAALAASEWLVPHVFGGRWAMFWCFEVAVVGYALGYLGRGVFAGIGSFADFGRLIVGESATRMVFSAVLFGCGVHTAWPYAAAIAAAPFASLLIVSRGGRALRLSEGTGATWAEMSRSLGLLLLGSLSSQFLANAGPVSAQVASSHESGVAAGRFLAALVVARVTLFLFQPVQVAILPNLSELVARGRVAELRSAVTKMTAVACALLLITTALAWLAGRPVLGLLFGSGFLVSRTTLAALALGTGAYIVALALNGAAIALGGQQVSASAWGAGSVAFLVSLALGGPLFVRIETAYVIGAAVAAVTMVAGVYLRLGRVSDPVTATPSVHNGGVPGNLPAAGAPEQANSTQTMPPR